MKGDFIQGNDDRKRSTASLFYFEKNTPTHPSPIKW